MQVCDYSRSFCGFEIDTKKQPALTMSRPAPQTHNVGRFPIDCRCVITSENQSRQYVLGASCKSEQVNVKQDVWHDPCADMCLILSDDYALVIKSWDHRGRKVDLHPPTLGTQPLRHTLVTKEAYSQSRIDLHSVEGRLLKTAEETIEAGLANLPLISQTEWTLDDGRNVLLEYPVKVCNFGPREIYYQVDTGPILIPNPAREHKHEIESLELAYIAHNAVDWAEVVVNVPTSIEGGAVVDHYSESRRLENVVNRMIALD